MAPTSRAGSPARRRSTDSLGNPASSTPATIPNASSKSCTLPNTSRLAPATISPEASSTVAVVSTPPGRNVTSGAIRVRSPGSAAPRLTASKLSAETAIAESTGTSTVSVWRPRGGQHEGSDQYAEAGRDRHVRRGRLQYEAESDRHRRIPEHGDRRAVARRHRTDVPQAAQPLGRLDGASLGLVDELVEGGDLIQAQRTRELGIDSIVAQPARPKAIMSAVGRTTMRASCAPLAAATAVRRSSVSLTAVPARLSARPSSSTNACRSVTSAASGGAVDGLIGPE